MLQKLRILQTIYGQRLVKSSRIIENETVRLYTVQFHWRSCLDESSSSKAKAEFHRRSGQPKTCRLPCEVSTWVSIYLRENGRGKVTHFWFIDCEEVRVRDDSLLETVKIIPLEYNQKPFLLYQICLSCTDSTAMFCIHHLKPGNGTCDDPTHRGTILHWFQKHVFMEMTFSLIEILANFKVSKDTKILETKRKGASSRQAARKRGHKLKRNNKASQKMGHSPEAP